MSLFWIVSSWKKKGTACPGRRYASVLYFLNVDTALFESHLLGFAKTTRLDSLQCRRLNQEIHQGETKRTLFASKLMEDSFMTSTE